MKHIILYAVLFSVSFNWAQDQKQVVSLLADSKKMYEQKDYQLDINYQVFSDASEKNEIEHYSGHIAKKGIDMYMRIHQTETLLLGNDFVKVNHEEKAMLVSKHRQASGMMALDEVKKLLPKFKTCEVKQEGNVLQCILKASEITQLPYRKIIMVFDVETKALVKQELFLSSAVPFEDQNGQKKWSSPKAVFTFSSPQTYQEQGKLKLSNYLKYSNGKLIVAKELTNYHIEKI